MEVLQTTSKELISYTVWKKSNQNQPTYLTSNWREYNRLKQAEYRAKKKALQPKKLPSPFQQTKTQRFLKLLINHHSFVPVPAKFKHPIIKKWNANNYWYPKKLDFNNLERGCVRIIIQV